MGRRAGLGCYFVSTTPWIAAGTAEEGGGRGGRKAVVIWWWRRRKKEEEEEVVVWDLAKLNKWPIKVGRTNVFLSTILMFIYVWPNRRQSLLPLLFFYFPFFPFFQTFNTFFTKLIFKIKLKIILFFDFKFDILLPIKFIFHKIWVMYFIFFNLDWSIGRELYLVFSFFFFSILNLTCFFTQHSFLFFWILLHNVHCSQKSNKKSQLFFNS